MEGLLLSEWLSESETMRTAKHNRLDNISHEPVVGGGGGAPSSATNLGESWSWLLLGGTAVCAGCAGSALPGGCVP